MNTFQTRKQELDSFLDSIDARKIQEYTSPTGVCRFYADGDGIGFIIQITGRHKDSDDFSWEAFVPPTADNRVSVTFEHIKKALADVRDKKV